MPETAGHAVAWESVNCFIRTRNCGVCYAASGRDETCRSDNVSASADTWAAPNVPGPFFLP